MVVPIEQVCIREGRSAPPRLFVKQMAEVLKRQGQIEPLQVKRGADGLYHTFLVDPHGDEITHAAKMLGWTTLLVVEMERYEA